MALALCQKREANGDSHFGNGDRELRGNIQNFCDKAMKLIGILKPLSPVELRLLGHISEGNTVGTNISEDRVTKDKVEESLEVFEKNRHCSAEQQMIFCDFLEENPVLLNKKLNANMSPTSYEIMWDDLASILNAGGKVSKTTKEWKQEEEVDLPTAETMIVSPIESSTQDLNEDVEDILKENILLLSPNGYSTEQIVATTPMSFSIRTSRKRKMNMEVNDDYDSHLSSKRNSSSIDVHPNMEEDAQNSSAMLKTIDRMAHSMEEISDKFQRIQEHTVDMSKKMGNICESLKTIAESIKILANVSVARAETEGLEINF